MSIQNISSKIFILMLFMLNFSQINSLTVNPIQFHKTYSFDLKESSKFVIYSFKNDMNIDDTLIFRFLESPKKLVSVKVYLYFSLNDVSDSIDNLIKCNPYTGEFFGSFFNFYLYKMYDDFPEFEEVIGSHNCESQYLMPGYIYAAISIVSIREYEHYSSKLIVFNTKFMPEISIANKYEYFELRGPYYKNITFFIPSLSSDILLKIECVSTINNEKYITIYQNNLETLFYKKIIDSNKFDVYINLTKGYSYYCQIYQAFSSYKRKILFQFPLNEFMKIEEGKVLYTSTLNNNYYYFYYDNKKMNVKDLLYFKIDSNQDDIIFRYREILYDDYDYIHQRIEYPDYASKCELNNKLKIGNITSHFYYIEKREESQIFVFFLKAETHDLTTFEIEIFSKKIISSPEGEQKIFKRGETGYYSFDLEKLKYFNKNILIYTNSNEALRVFCYDFDISFHSYSYNNYRNYTGLRLYFVDPSNPETRFVERELFSGYISIIINHPLLEEYSIDIKFIDKNLYFIKEFVLPIQEKIIRRTYYNNITSNMNVYQAIKYIEQNNEKIEKYSITYQKLYGNFEITGIILDNIKVNTIDEFLNSDFSFKENYITPLTTPSILGKYMFIHIKINSNKYIPLPYDHIAFYENIIKINYEYSKKLSEGEQIIIFLEKDKPTDFYFEEAQDDFNLEIKFLGKIMSDKYIVYIKTCDGKEAILNNKNQIYRGKCEKIFKCSYITLINKGLSLTGVIIKRALPKEYFNIISNTISKNLCDNTLLVYEKAHKYHYYFFTKLAINLAKKYPSFCLFQEYSDIDYISYPPKQACLYEKENISSYSDLTIDNNLIYGEKSAKGRIIDSDNLNLFIAKSYNDIELNFKRIIKVNVSEIEEKDFVLNNNYDIYYYLFPKKTSLNDYNSIFLQAFPASNNDRFSFSIYCNEKTIKDVYNLKEKILELPPMNEEDQLYIYIYRKVNTAFRFKLYNSKEDEFIGYNYIGNLNVLSKINFKIIDKNILPCKIEIKPKNPHEITGCHNYYFFVLNPKYENLNYSNYYQFLHLNSSVFYQNFTAKNVCSENNKFLEKDLDKFTFDFNMKKTNPLIIVGYSEQISLFNALRYEGYAHYFYNYTIEFYKIIMEINNNKLILLDEEMEETSKYKISFDQKGLLNVFWKGSNSYKVQEVEFYNGLNICSSNLIYKSLIFSDYEHNYSIKVRRDSELLLIYKSKDDLNNNRTIFFDFTHNLGKEFGINNIKNEKKDYKNWIVYTSGIYKFYLEIDKKDINLDNEFYAYKYNFKNNSYNSISSIKLSYLNEQEILIKSYEIEGNVNKKLIDSENHTFFYFMPGDNLKRLLKKENLKYIQIQFKLKFKDEGGPEALDEISIEAIPPLKIKENDWNRKINDLFEENSGKLGIYYINLNEAIYELNQNILFYTNSKNLSDILYIGNILDFNLNKNNRTKNLYNIEKQFFVFNKETINNYISTYDEKLILLIIDGTKKSEKFENIFLEFKYLDNLLNDIIFNENDIRSNNQKIVSFYSEYECLHKKKYYITYYSSSQKEKEIILFSKKIYGKIDIYYINETFIFSDSVKTIEDILPDKNDKYLINKHPNEIAEGTLNIFAITCKNYPALSVFYSFEKEEEKINENITFLGSKNSFIGYFFPEDYSQIEKKLFFENIESDEFIVKIKILEIVGFVRINIKFRKNYSEEYSELEEGQEEIIESVNNIPSFRIDEDGIGKGVLFFEIIKGISHDEYLYDIYEEYGLDYELSQTKFAFLKYNKNTQIETESARIILMNENDKEAKICINYDFYIEPFISFPNCIEYSKISKNSKINILINNPYKINNNRIYENDEIKEEADFYATIKSDSPIKFIYTYSKNKENLPLNYLTSISTTGDFIYNIEENLIEEKNFIYQLNKCNLDKRVYLIYNSKIYDNFGNNNYGILKKYKYDNMISIINEGENNEKKSLYFVLSENDIDNENIDELFHINATFTYRQEKNNIIFNIDNFAEEEFDYYSILSFYNNTNELEDFCFFIEFFNNNNTLFSKTKSKGKGINSTTIITHNISEECFSLNCTIMVFARSENKNISKIYSPKMLNILEKYNENKKLLYIAIACGGGFILILIIIIIVFYKRKKNKEGEINDIYSKINDVRPEMLEKEFLSDSLNTFEKKQFSKNSSSNNNESVYSDLPSESQIYTKNISKSTTGVNYGPAPSL